jgi:hypothetical protein
MVNAVSIDRKTDLSVLSVEALRVRTDSVLKVRARSRLSESLDKHPATLLDLEFSIRGEVSTGVMRHALVRVSCIEADFAPRLIAVLGDCILVGLTEAES